MRGVMCEAVIINDEYLITDPGSRYDHRGLNPASTTAIENRMEKFTCSALY